MIDIEMLRQYQEWSANNLGRMVDVSPEAFELHFHLQELSELFRAKADDDEIVSTAAMVVVVWDRLNAPTD